MDEQAATSAGTGAISVAVLSCDVALGALVANGVARLPRVQRVSLLTAPWTRKQLGIVALLRRLHRLEGPAGVATAIVRRTLRLLQRMLRRPVADAPERSPRIALDPRVTWHECADFHGDDARALLTRIAPDLGVLAGTYILRESVFGIPRLGTINLHSGKAPAYRGAAPAFWELYNGERSVGITIHRVAAELDAGEILLQEEFPLERAPATEPLAYVERYRDEVLRPNGVRLLVDAVRGIAEGTLRGIPQDDARAATYRTPDYRAKRELRRRVRARRRGGAAQ